MMPSVCFRFVRFSLSSLQQQKKIGSVSATAAASDARWLID